MPKDRMTYAERQADEQERYKMVRKWQGRIKRAKINRRQFCLKYGYDEGHMSRMINGHTLPDWETVHAVERALEKEKV